MWPPESVRSKFSARPVTIVDVGARGGRQAHWSSVGPFTRLVGYEPNVEEHARLVGDAGEHEVFLNTALYSEPAELSLYCTLNPNCTSIYKPNSALLGRLAPENQNYQVTSVERIHASTLDSSLFSAGIKSVDFIKLDTQGSELDILRGGERTLSDGCFGIEVEVEFVQLYENQPLFPDVHEYLFSHGYQFIDFASSYSVADFKFMSRAMMGYSSRKAFVKAWVGRALSVTGSWRGGQQLLYADAIYFRDPAEYLAADPGEAKLRAHVSVFICCVLGYYGYASRVIETAKELKVINQAEVASLETMVQKSARSGMRLRADFARAGRRLVHRLRHPGR